MNTKTDNSPSKLIHHDKNPIRSQGYRFAPEEVGTPETILGVTDERQPRRTSCNIARPVTNCQNATDDVLVDLDAEGQCDLLTAGRIRKVQRPAMTRSESRRLEARFLPRFRISN